MPEEGGDSALDESEGEVVMPFVDDTDHDQCESRQGEARSE